MLKKILFFGMVLFLLLALLAGVFFMLNYAYSREPYREMVYQVNQLKTSLDEMEKDKIIFSSRLAGIILSLTGNDKKVKRGVYQLDNHMGMIKVMSALVGGKQKLVSITIKEGDDIYDIANTLVEKKVITNQKVWLQLVSSPQQLAKAKQLLGFPKIKLVSLEGLLYPDTYSIYVGDPVEKIIDLALGEFKDRIHNQLESLQLTENSKWAYYIIASLIEKETALLEEKPLVASVIYNRLRQKMKLRIDPTIIYALKVSRLYDQNLKGGKINIKREHFQFPSPYNTYYVKALPISPISSFSETSLKAALYPAKSDYLFFVAKKKGELDKGHYFSVTYEEHLENINKHLKK